MNRGRLYPTLLTAILLWSSGAALTPLAAADLSTPYTQTGRVDYVGISNNTIVINDREHPLAADTTVRMGNSIVSRTVLTKGMKVGFRGGWDAPDKKIEIWILQ